MKTCIICSTSKNNKLYYQCVDYNVLRCAKCGLIFVDEEFRDNVKVSRITDIHKDVYASVGSELRSKSNEYINILSNYVKNDSKLLDVGCNYGYFMELAHAQGYDITGVDIQKDMIDAVKEKGYAAYWGGVIDLPADAYYDVITAWNVIEHLNDPKQFLLSVKSHLMPKGYLFLETPNSRSLLKQLSLIYFRFTRPGKRLFREYLHKPGGGHAFDFNMHNISLLLGQTGYEVVKITGSTAPFRLHIKFAFKSHHGMVVRIIRVISVLIIRAISGIAGSPNRMFVVARLIV